MSAFRFIYHILDASLFIPPYNFRKKNSTEITFHLEAWTFRRTFWWVGGGSAIYSKTCLDRDQGL